MKYKPYKKKGYTFIYELSLIPLYLLSELLETKVCAFIGAKHLKFRHAARWKNRIMTAIVDLEEDRKISEFLQQKIKDKNYRNKMISSYYREMADLHSFVKAVSRKNLRKESNKKLWDYLSGFEKKFVKMYLWGYQPNALEGKEGLFTQYLQNQLENRLKQINKTNFLNEYFSTLVTSVRGIPREKQEQEFLGIVGKIQHNQRLKKAFLENPAEKTMDLLENYPSVNKILAKHQKQYGWLMFKYEGPTWDKFFIISLIRDYLKDKVTVQKKIERMRETKKKILKLQKKYLFDLKLKPREELFQYLDFSKELMHLKEHQKDNLFQVYYYLDPLIIESARRLNLSPVQFRHLLVPEMKKALLDGKFDVNVLNERIKNSFLVIGPKKVERVAIGREAAKIEKIMFPPLPKLKEFKGEVAAPGKVRGIVSIIQETKDNGKMKKGNIFVTTRSNPNLLPAMRLASAIVADIGGITSHAAIIARELGIPAVVGVHFASMILKDGDKVEVDAEKGIVKLLK